MLTKEIEVGIDATTFPGGAAAPNLSPGTHQLDVNEALLLLGTFSIPGGLTAASPARFWAWIRYLSAIAKTPDLRVSVPFSELDPHQKSVLSDDFGVAVSMQWLYRQLNGFRSVVDGRLFLLHYAHLLKQLPPAPAKHGPRKCPDFVVEDSAGFWHVIECKGTQTGTWHSDRQLKRAQEQKQAIALVHGAGGHSLAAGVFLATDGAAGRSRLMVHDPVDESPLMRLEDTERARRISTRLCLASALGLAGFTEFSEELAYVDTKEQRILHYQTKAERLRGTRSLEDRNNEVAASLQRPRRAFEVAGRSYRGQEVSVDMTVPSFGDVWYRVTASVGMGQEFLSAVGDLGRSHLIQHFEERITKLKNEQSVLMESEASRTVIKLGDSFIAEVSIRKIGGDAAPQLGAAAP